MDPAILTFDTPQAAAEACGDRTLELLGDAQSARGLATLAVSGGNTPRLMFQAMAKRSFNWSGVHVYQVDERCVPPGDEASNFRMIKEFLLRAARIEDGQVHRIAGELAPEEAAREYVGDIQRSFHLRASQLPVFDVIQRGMGPDGHTASLFPGEPLIADRAGIAAAVVVDKPYIDKTMRDRVTLLPGVLEGARHTLCLVTGADKAEALSKVLRGAFDPALLPAQIRSQDTVWYIDKSAAKML